MKNIAMKVIEFLKRLLVDDSCFAQKCFHPLVRSSCFLVFWTLSGAILKKNNLGFHLLQPQAVLRISWQYRCSNDLGYQALKGLNCLNKRCLLSPLLLKVILLFLTTHFKISRLLKSNPLGWAFWCLPINWIFFGWNRI